MRKIKIILITGKSGSGKSTLTKKLRNTSTIAQDNYYKDIKTHKKEKIKNHDVIEAIDIKSLKRDIKKIKYGPIKKRVYDFKRQSSKYEGKIYPKKYVIVEGSIIGVSREIRKLVNVHVHIEVPERIRIARRIGRDIKRKAISATEIKKHYQETVKKEEIINNRKITRTKPIVIKVNRIKNL